MLFAAAMAGSLAWAGTAPIRDSDDYLRRKWREDLSDRSTGRDAKALRKDLRALVDACKEKDPWPIVKAKMFAHLCDNVAIDVSGYDWFPTFSPWAYHKDHPVSPILRRRNDEIDRLKLPEAAKTLQAGNKAGRWTCWKDFCHSVPDWDVIVKLGFPGMKKRLRDHWRETPFYAALDLTADACLRMIDRFVELGERRLGARNDSAEDRARPAMRIARQVESLKRLRTGAPKTAYDVLMFIYLDWVLSENMDQFQVRSLSNLDQMLTPYYRADLAAGRTTEAEFREQLKAFWWQWGSIDNYWGQPVYFGGTKADGTTEYNEVSKILLDVHDELALPTPKVQLKMAKSTPDWVWEKTLDMVRRHRSLVFCGEEPMTKVMKSQGHTDEECRTLEIRGCYEFQARGTESRTSIGHINLLKPVADLLEAARAGAFEAATWEAFRAAYEKAMTETVDECLRLGYQMESVLGDINCGNLFSLAERSAIEKGEDAFTTGLKYNNTGILQVGLGTTVDALLAVKEIVYEKRELTLAALGQLMADDWKGRDDLRLRMLRSKRKWGNNDAEANALGHDIGKLYASHINFRTNSRGGVFQANGHCAKQFIVLGEKTGATPDGRKKGDEMSKNLSATMGADTEGVTALLATLASLDATDFPGDFPLDVMLLPYTVAGEKGLKAMRTVVETYFANGGCAIHFNIVDPEMLRDAQKHPEKYENLQIRVCGWNVRWNDIPPKEQAAYIRRAEEIGR